MILLRMVRAQASGSLVGANLAPVSQTSEEDGSALFWGGGRLDRNVCRSGPESDGDGIYGDIQGVASGQFTGFVLHMFVMLTGQRNQTKTVENMLQNPATEQMPHQVCIFGKEEHITRGKGD